MRRTGLTSVALAAVFSITAARAWAEAPTTICVPEHASSQVLSTNAKGECPSKVISKTTVKYKSAALPGPAELERLDKVLPHVNYVDSGVGGKPTIQFSGVNVQIVNGAGGTGSTNGAGNLVIGYDEHEAAESQTGSHDLVLGEEQIFTSYGGIVAGRQSRVSGPFASVTGGFLNQATGYESSVSGGSTNLASGLYTSITGGRNNTSRGNESSITGGMFNVAEGEHSSISGGGNGTTVAAFSSISGGDETTASGVASSVTGGFGNVASGQYASLSGGVHNEASAKAASVSGGSQNAASGEYASISGGKEARAATTNSWIGGGLKNETFSKGQPGEEGLFAAIFGSNEEKTAFDYAAIP